MFVDLFIVETMEKKDDVRQGGTWIPTIVVLILLVLRWLVASESAIAYRRQLQMLVSSVLQVP